VTRTATRPPGATAPAVCRRASVMTGDGAAARAGVAVVTEKPSARAAANRAFRDISGSQGEVHVPGNTLAGSFATHHRVAFDARGAIAARHLATFLL
jgi:hypothetical protein